ncbi:hypothetical protein [Paraburkholderia terrae]|uniref:hypothetical protein n=1 Tax=Paraburkholderia terrae TaxID=311230 RepID=UPI001EE3877D|nr:hypothetical protein [Paraburkholderia terrae]GJH04994.1 hypothetical protein CBA19C8_30575 [Paraburkholderia terrae]
MTNEDIDALWDEVVRNDESHTPRQIHRCFAHAVIERFAAPVADSAEKSPAPEGGEAGGAGVSREHRAPARSSVGGRIQFANVADSAMAKDAPGNCHKCGLPMSVNPHPEAGKPPHYLNVGCPRECIPCLVKSRHSWAQQAMRDRRYAERYRHLRDCNSGSLMIVQIIGTGDDDQVVLTEEDADFAIDAAIAASAEKGDKA